MNAKLSLTTPFDARWSVALKRQGSEIRSDAPFGRKVHSNHWFPSGRLKLNVEEEEGTERKLARGKKSRRNTIVFRQPSVMENTYLVRGSGGRARRGETRRRGDAVAPQRTLSDLSLPPCSRCGRFCRSFACTRVPRRVRRTDTWAMIHFPCVWY